MSTTANRPASAATDVPEFIAAGANKAPRITPADIEAEIAEVYYFLPGIKLGVPEDHPLRMVTFCVLVLRNGFTVVGHSACASPENFNDEIGRKIAREKAVEQIWPLLGYELRSKLSEGKA